MSRITHYDAHDALTVLLEESGYEATPATSAIVGGIIDAQHRALVEIPSTTWEYRTMFTCDDCGLDYEGPAYYTFDPDACVSTREWVQEGERVEPPTSLGSGNVEDDDLILHGDDCTGNVCPDCAGPYLTPDDENDPRRPKEA